MNGIGVDDSVDEMIANPKRGLRHYSKEWQAHHLTKDEVYGFQLIADELSNTNVCGGGERNKYFQKLINTKGRPSRRRQLQEVQGKLGLHPFVYMVV